MKINTNKMIALVPCLLVITLGISCLTYSTEGGIFINISKLNLSLIAIGGTCIFASFCFLLKSQSGVKKFVLNQVDFGVLLWFIFITGSSLIIKKDLNQEGYLSLVVGILFYFSCRLTIFNERKRMLSVFLLGIGLLTAIESIIAILQFFTFIPSLNEFFTTTGTFKNPAPLALFLSSCLPLIYFSFCIVTKSWLKIFFAFDLILSLFAISICGNRASYLAIIVIICVYLALRFNLFSITFYSLPRRLSKIISVSIIVGILILILNSLYSLKPVSADGRLLIWTVSYPHIFDHPIFGGGIGSFKENYSIWQAKYFSSHYDTRLLSDTFVSNIAGNVRLAYNEYLEILLEQGILGLVLFCSIFYYSFQFVIPRLTKHQRSLAIPIMASLLAILTQSVISYPLHSLPSIILMFLLLAFLNNEIQIVLIKQKVLTGKGKTTVISFLLLFAGLLTLFSGVRRLKNYDTYLSARKLFNRDQSNSRNLFETLSVKLSTDPNFLIDYSICLASNKEYDAAITNLIKASKLDGDPQIYILLGDLYTKVNKYDLAEKSYNFASLIVPSLIYPKYALVKLLISRGKIDGARVIAKTILSSRVKLPSERTDKMIREMRLFLDGVEGD